MCLIAEHIASGVWRDKSGAYAIKEPDPASPNGYAVASDPFVDHIEGSLSNVMGLPMELVERLLLQEIK